VADDDGAGTVEDPVVARRLALARLVRYAQYGGYLLFAIACVGFGIGFGTGFADWTVNLIKFCLLAGSVLLAPAIVLGYALKAADRADREGDWR
jgi:hypothetical protein